MPYIYKKTEDGLYKEVEIIERTSRETGRLFERLELSEEEMSKKISDISDLLKNAAKIALEIFGVVKTPVLIDEETLTEKVSDMLKGQMSEVIIYDPSNFLPIYLKLHREQP